MPDDERAVPNCCLVASDERFASFMRDEVTTASAPTGRGAPLSLCTRWMVAARVDSQRAELSPARWSDASLLALLWPRLSSVGPFSAPTAVLVPGAWRLAAALVGHVRTFPGSSIGHG